MHDPGEIPRLGDPLVDEYLRFVASRARTTPPLAQTFDLKVFFTIVGKTPTQVDTSDVFAFIQAQRLPRNDNVVRIADGESGLAASTIKRRLASIAGLFSYLSERGLLDNSPVPQGLTTRAGRSHMREIPLFRSPRRLPRILDPDEANALLGALRSERDRAMILADAIRRTAQMRGPRPANAPCPSR